MTPDSTGETGTGKRRGRRPAGQDTRTALLEAALTESEGRVAGPRGAAAKLGMRPSTLESKIRSLKINKHRFREA